MFLGKGFLTLSERVNNGIRIVYCTFNSFCSKYIKQNILKLINVHPWRAPCLPMNKGEQSMLCTIIFKLFMGLKHIVAAVKGNTLDTIKATEAC